MGGKGVILMTKSFLHTKVVFLGRRVYDNGKGEKDY